MLKLPNTRVSVRPEGLQSAPNILTFALNYVPRCLLSSIIN